MKIKVGCNLGGTEPYLVKGRIEKRLVEFRGVHSSTTGKKIV